MHKNIELSCIDCFSANCNKGDSVYPKFCLTSKLNHEDIDDILTYYNQEENKNVTVSSAEVEYEGYCQLTRIEEIILFANKINAEKLGIATCVGLINESRILAKILRKHGFEVYGVGCKIGAVPKTEVGIPPKCEEIGTNMPNPITKNYSDTNVPE